MKKEGWGAGGGAEGRRGRGGTNEPQADGRMFLSVEAANHVRRPAPSGKGRAQAEGVRLNLKSVVTGWSSLPRAAFFLLTLCPCDGCADVRDEDPGVACSL